MCGIVGYIGQNDAYPVLIEGLKKLEYRGYDSAGVALIDRAAHLPSPIIVNPVQSDDMAHPAFGEEGRVIDEVERRHHIQLFKIVLEPLYIVVNLYSLPSEPQYVIRIILSTWTEWSVWINFNILSERRM